MFLLRVILFDIRFVFFKQSLKGWRAVKQGTNRTYLRQNFDVFIRSERRFLNVCELLCRSRNFITYQLGCPALLLLVGPVYTQIVMSW